jgi:hypothetical protein
VFFSRKAVVAPVTAAFSISWVEPARSGVRIGIFGGSGVGRSTSFPIIRIEGPFSRRFRIQAKGTEAMTNTLDGPLTAEATAWNWPRPSDDGPASRSSVAGYPVPELGFSSYRVSGGGEYVLWVRQGSTAARLGLAPGDVILAVNGHRLTWEGAWHRAIGQAAGGHGRVSLEICGGRTRSIAHHTCHLFSTRGVSLGGSQETIERE